MGKRKGGGGRRRRQRRKRVLDTKIRQTQELTDTLLTIEGTNKTAWSVPEHEGDVCAIAAEDTTVVAGTMAGSVRAFKISEKSIRTGSKLKKGLSIRDSRLAYICEASVRAICFMGPPDARMICVGDSRGTIYLLDPEEDKILRRIHHKCPPIGASGTKHTKTGESSKNGEDQTVVRPLIETLGIEVNDPTMEQNRKGKGKNENPPPQAQVENQVQAKEPIQLKNKSTMLGNDSAIASMCALKGSVYNTCIAVGDDGGGVTVYDLRKGLPNQGAIARFREHADATMAVSYNVPRKSLVSVGADGHVVAYDCRKRSRIVMQAVSDSMEEDLAGIVAVPDRGLAVVGHAASGLTKEQDVDGAIEDGGGGRNSSENAPQSSLTAQVTTQGGGVLSVWKWGYWGDLMTRITGLPAPVVSLATIPIDGASSVLSGNGVVAAGCADGSVAMVQIQPVKVLILRGSALGTGLPIDAMCGTWIGDDDKDDDSAEEEQDEEEDAQDRGTSPTKKQKHSHGILDSDDEDGGNDEVDDSDEFNDDNVENAEGMGVLMAVSGSQVFFMQADRIGKIMAEDPNQRAAGYSDSEEDDDENDDNDEDQTEEKVDDDNCEEEEEPASKKASQGGFFSGLM
eukprot:Clim_evm11s64 gene=Clim_evmTU11s64